MKRGAFVYLSEAGAFSYGPDHPFDPHRAVRTYELCDRYSLLEPEDVVVLPPAPVGEADLALAHTPAYLDALRRADEGVAPEDAADWGLGTSDCPVFRGVYRHAVLAAGATIAAFEAVVGGAARCAFNPSGGFHHAFADRAEGFCYINDLVIVLAKLKQAGKRPVFVDIDAHQPNGVIAPFYADPGVLCITLHESPRTLYPFKGWCEEFGEGEGRGYTLNLPLEPGADDEVFTRLFRRIVPAALDRFRPDCIVLEAGMDMLKTDPLAHLGLSSNALVGAVRLLANRGLPVIATGGGGYDIRNTVRGWTRVWATLIGREPVDVFAGVVGGMMFGPETEAGSLVDPPVIADGEGKRLAAEEAERVGAFIEKEVLPLIQGPRGAAQ
ncbi:MAG TPA: acetoin utilization protein AcuC [Planctomycetota bacterium]|nr:acetoin utilization protein AcuC [Planctomycetota bacterium]OQC20643.1 MAG: Acetoin utilization protein AcuC [Planctomycetes bacterium ADurb.Bin069]NMD36866.1 acetoin utilization protein AcuC [Planctomycetota bacterium]HNR98767.1 acetoin utilization protein AcuC [Planctomycetota bacterium]HNU25475.1 acetoin utilization protein AcuC [Planctomycetota bacterium]